MENAFQNHTQTLDAEQISTNSMTRLAATGGIIGGIAASACCLLPLILTILGVGGAWMSRLRAMEVYQPYFIAMAIATLGYGFYQVYWKSPKACVAGSACAKPLSNRLVKAGLWAGAVIVTSALSFPYWFPIIVPYLP